MKLFTAKKHGKKTKMVADMFDLVVKFYVLGLVGVLVYW